ncbi:ABC transporter permease [Candidatus Dependentiae bacterium]|nr:ABC transporter permease [Candidatus Dependentiae bacterium]
MNIRSWLTALVLPSIVGITYTMLYIPIIILIVFSFNDAEMSFVWKGFSWRWYQALFQSVEVWNALYNSLIVACSSVVLSLILGVLFVFYSAGTRLNRLVVAFYGTLAAPEIVLAIGLLSLFSFFGVPLGMVTLIAGHTLLGLGYVVPMVYDRFSELDYRLMEASLDLGATRTQTFFRIIVPLLSPALLAAALLVFIISLDDFLISFFCAGASTLTLPMYIFSVLRTGATPLVNALSTLLLCVSSLCVLIFSSLRVKSQLF